jgi:hypothetical protein
VLLVVNHAMQRQIWHMGFFEPVGVIWKVLVAELVKPYVT